LKNQDLNLVGYLFFRPQKRRAYIANLFNAISMIANRKEEMLHES
jgi:hypothetical protein